MVDSNSQGDSIPTPTLTTVNGELMRYALIFACVLTCNAYAADESAMEQMSKTGAEHAALAKLVGTWDVQATMYMDPTAPPMVSAATAAFTMIHDGKWLSMDYRGEWMNQPFTGTWTLGYDTIAKRYVDSWIDSSSTQMGTSSGTSTDGGKTITFITKKDYCPMTGGPVTERYVFIIESADRMLFNAFKTAEGGSEQKSMELVYTRKKAAK